MSAVDRIQEKRGRLIGRMRQAVEERRFKAQAEIGRELRDLTTRQLQAELREQRKLYRATRFGRGAAHRSAACRTKSKRIAERIKENA